FSRDWSSDVFSSDLFLASSRAARLLEGTRNISRVPRHDARLQLTDINTEFQRICADDGPDVPFPQALFDFSPLRRQITAPIAHRSEARRVGTESSSQ